MAGDVGAGGGADFPAARLRDADLGVVRFVPARFPPVRFFDAGSPEGDLDEVDLPDFDLREGRLRDVALPDAGLPDVALRDAGLRGRFLRFAPASSPDASCPLISATQRLVLSQQYPVPHKLSLRIMPP